MINESRKVTDKVASAFLAHQKARVSNTHTDGTAYYLHNNKIAEFRGNDLWISNAGWFSNTTKERLNALPNVSIYQKAGVWYLNGKEWDGKWTNVSNAKESVSPTMESRLRKYISKIIKEEIASSHYNVERDGTIVATFDNYDDALEFTHRKSLSGTKNGKLKIVKSKKYDENRKR